MNSLRPMMSLFLVPFLMALLAPVGAQAKKKTEASNSLPIIRSVAHHEPIPAYLVEASEKANAADRRGEELLKEGRYNEAISAFQTALSYEPHDGLAYQHIAESYTALGQQDKAIAAYRTLFYDWPSKSWGDSIGSNSAVLMRFALVLLSTGQRGEALTVYQQGRKYLPTDCGPLPPLFDSPDFSPIQFQAAIYASLGLTEFAGGNQDMDRASDYFQQALRLQPSLPQPYYYLGRILQNKPGRAADALDSFAKAVQFGGPAMQSLIDRVAKEGTSGFTTAAKEAGLTAQ